MIQGSTQDYFNQEELIQIYQQAGSTAQDALLAAARDLFPERMTADAPPSLKAETGLHGRWFIRNDETGPEEPVCTIKSGHCSWIGVLADGTALPY